MDEATYRSGMTAMTDLVGRLDDDQLLVPCPQCPGWTIRDVVAHVVHVFGERIGGWPEPIATDVFDAAMHPDRAVKNAAATRRDEWIEAGVDAFRPRPFSDVLAAWDTAAAEADEVMWTLVTDLAVHLADIEEALAVAGTRDNAHVAAALGRYSWVCNEHLSNRTLPTVAIIGTDPEFEGGDLDSSHRVTGTTYELLRTITGRRSRREADRALDWGTTPEPVRTVLPIYDWLDTDSGVELSLTG